MSAHFTAAQVLRFPAQSRVSGHPSRTLDGLSAFHELQAEFELIESMTPDAADKAADRARQNYAANMKDTNR